MDKKALLDLLNRLRTVNDDFFTGRRAITLDIDYDQQSDVMYIAFDAPRPALGVSTDEGIIIRYDAETLRIVGFTIPSFQRHFLPQYPEFCFLLTRPTHEHYAADAAALSRTTSTLLTPSMAM
jgi:uncharacterized protein YuzE